MKYWIRHISLWGLIENKNKPDYFTGETENKAHQTKMTIMNLINSNMQNFDKSS
ncbi:hypothetical protein GvMRE_I1g158 [endosymbiont GvMRE of Glomus versiforme]|nr:hypothetical protein GvMRE_I1g158 [endosymbiont GvMRE of Glomus versiforme]